MKQAKNDKKTAMTSTRWKNTQWANDKCQSKLPTCTEKVYWHTGNDWLAQEWSRVVCATSSWYVSMGLATREGAESRWWRILHWNLQRGIREWPTGNKGMVVTRWIETDAATENSWQMVGLGVHQAIQLTCCTTWTVCRKRFSPR